MQMWLSGLADYCPGQSEIIDEYATYGIDWGGPSPTDVDSYSNSGISIPTISCPLDEAVLASLVSSIDFLEHSESFGIDIYVNSLHLVTNLISTV